jgi:CRISPR-associated protein Cas2
MVRDQEVLTLVIYDVENDRVRGKIAKACKDFGMEHIQFSAFRGPLPAARRKDLFAKLSDLLGDQPGRVLMVPVCEKDADAMREIDNRGHAVKSG